MGVGTAELRRKAAGAWKRKKKKRKKKCSGQAEPGTMIQLPSNFSLPLCGPLSSKSFGGEMWLKLELPLAGEAEGQESE